MTTNTLPKFNLASMGLQNDEELENLIRSSEPKESKTFRPGLHEVKVISQEYAGLAKDETWGKMKLVLEGAGGKTLKSTVLFPFQDLTKYKSGDKETTNYPGRRLVELLKALGLDTTAANVGKTIENAFGKEGGLVGKTLQVKMAYRGSHAVRKGYGEGSTIMLVDSHGTQIGKDTFDSYEAAYEYAEQRNINVTRFPDIVEFLPSTVAKTDAKNANW